METSASNRGTDSVTLSFAGTVARVARRLAQPFPPDDRSLGWEKATTISKEWDQATTEAAIEVAAYIGTHLGELAGARRDAADRTAKSKGILSSASPNEHFRRPLNDEQKRQVYIDRQFDSSSRP